MRIYESNDGDIEALFDESDDFFPICVADTWLERAEALELANAIFAALGAEAKTATNGYGTVNEALIAVAIEHGLTIGFRYAKGDGSIIETRELQPEVIQEGKAGKIVVGHDPDRDDVRAYRFDRIKGNVDVVTPQRPSALDRYRRSGGAHV